MHCTCVINLFRVLISSLLALHAACRSADLACSSCNSCSNHGGQHKDSQHVLLFIGPFKRHFDCHAGSPARALATLLGWMDFPSSVRAVLISAAVLAAAHELLARAAVYAVPKSVLKQGAQMSRQKSLIREDSDAPKAGVM